MSFLSRILSRPEKEELPIAQRHGQIGEAAAKKYLQRAGLKFLTANFKPERKHRGEVDLVFRDGDCLIFVEVKAGSPDDWTRPAARVNESKRRLLTKCAFDYLRLLKNPPIQIRFDVVEVLLEDSKVKEIRHLPNTFQMTPPYRYG